MPWLHKGGVTVGKGYYSAGASLNRCNWWGQSAHRDLHFWGNKFFIPDGVRIWVAHHSLHHIGLILFYDSGRMRLSQRQRKTVGWTHSINRDNSWRTISRWFWFQGKRMCCYAVDISILGRQQLSCCVNITATGSWVTIDWDTLFSNWALRKSTDLGVWRPEFSPVSGRTSLNRYLSLQSISTSTIEHSNLCLSPPSKLWE